MKKTIAIVLAIALTGIMVAAAFAADVFKYNGVVKEVKHGTNDIVFSAIKTKGDTNKVFPKNISITLKPDKFSFIEGAHQRVNAKNPPEKLWVNVQYTVKDGKNVANTIIIIPGGC